MNIWLLLLIFLGISALCCSVGYKKFVWFLSIGYGFAVAGLGISYFVYIAIKGTWDIITILQCVLYVAYGARLSGFLLYREIKNANYQKVLKEVTKKTEKKMPIFVSISVWITVAILYVIQTAPAFYRVYNGNTWIIGNEFNLKNVLLPAIGVVISFIGLIIESTADRQKSAQKAENPNMVATKKLYRIVRCPNYFGEILFWTGVFVGGILVYSNHVEQWIFSILAWISIVYIMINGAQRLDRRQEKRYGTIKEYREYADHTPLIIPLIPISHVGKYKVEDIEKNNKK